MSKFIGFSLCAILIACGPSQDEYDALSAEKRELEGQIAELEQQRKGLNENIEGLEAKNGNMSARLKALGENVEDLQGSLDRTQIALEELRSRERQAQARLETFRSLLSKFKTMIESGRLRVRIVRNRMVVELPEGVLFDSGRAKVKKEGEKTLTEVGAVLAELSGREFQIAGHTDNIPIRTKRFDSNWELSTARAVNVTRFLVAGGIAGESLSAAGYAETQPVASNDDKAGRAQNRRIEIVLVPKLDELPDLSSLEQK